MKLFGVGVCCRVVFGSVRVCFEFRSIPARGKVRERVTSSFGVASCYTNTQRHKHRSVTKVGARDCFRFQRFSYDRGYTVRNREKENKKGERKKTEKIDWRRLLSLVCRLCWYYSFFCVKKQKIIIWV